MGFWVIRHQGRIPHIPTGRLASLIGMCEESDLWQGQTGGIKKETKVNKESRKTGENR
jgi:hypothetical protein